MRHNAGKKFYTWLHSWNWDLSVMPGENPRVSCLSRYNESLAVNGASGLKIDACACDAIVTDCHVYAESEGSGKKENSGPFNVHNGVSGAAGRLYPTLEYTHTNTRWWNGNDYFMPDPVGYVTFATALLHFALSRLKILLRDDFHLVTGIRLMLSKRFISMSALCFAKFSCDKESD
jgi:hypothetical protein